MIIFPWILQQGIKETRVRFFHSNSLDPLLSIIIKNYIKTTQYFNRSKIKTLDSQNASSLINFINKQVQYLNFADKDLYDSDVSLLPKTY